MNAANGRATSEPDETTPFLAAAQPGLLRGGVRQKQSARAAPLGEAIASASSERAARSRAAAGTTLLLIANALERTTYFALTTSLVYILTRTPLCWTDSQATVANLVFAGVSLAADALGGLLADCFASRFGAAAVGYVPYAAAYIPLVVLGAAASGFEDDALPERNASAFACEQEQWHRPRPGPPWAFSLNASFALWCGGSDAPICGAWVIGTGLTIAIAQGIVHTNLVTFGADQVRQYGAELTRCYFSMLYWTRNVGAVVAVAGMSYLQIGTFGLCLNYAVSLICLLLSAAVFGAGFKFYVRRQPNISDIVKFLRVLPDALRLKRLAADRRWPNGTPDSILDYAKAYYDGPYHDKTVEEVKNAGRMLIVFVLLISYYIGFTELVSSFSVQGLHMEAPGSTGKNPTPPGVFLVFDSLSVLIALPFLNNVAYPFLGRRGWRITLHMRISTGMLFAALSFVAAGIVETIRLDRLSLGIVPQTIGHTIYDAAPMSVMYQIPQYVFLGISEAFVCVTAMEYTYLLAPKAMRSIMIGLLLALPSIGPFVSSALHRLYANAFGWSNVNDSHMDYAYYALAGLQFLGSFSFYVIGRFWPLGLDLSTIVFTRRLPTQLLNG